MIISEKIILFITIWIMILFFITKDEDLEIYFVLIFLGFFFIIELTERFTTTKVKNRLRILFFVFIIIFVILAGTKIITFLGI